MLQHVELDAKVPLFSQFADTLKQPILLVNLFTCDHQDQTEFKQAWTADAYYFCSQPGCLTAQLHQGIQNSSLFLNYAIFETAAAFAATTQQPQFVPLRKPYPDSAVAHPHLFRRVAIPGICIGERKAPLESTRRNQPKTGSQHQDLDPQAPLTSQLADAQDLAVVLITFFTVDAADREDFKLAWAQDAAFLTQQPGCLSAQLHQGLHESSYFLSYSVLENAASCAAITQQPEFEALRQGYPDSTVARPHLFRRLNIPGICAGEID